MEGTFVTIREIIDKLKRNPLMQDLLYEEALDYAIECIRRLGVSQFEDHKLDKIEIKNNRGILPNDIIVIESARLLTRVITPSGRKDVINPMTGTLYNEVHNAIETPRRMDRASLNFNRRNKHTPEYDINGKYIFTTFNEGVVEIKYRGLYLDKKGHPLIPDNQDIVRAIMEWIKKERYEILYALGRINRTILEDAKQEYSWYVGKAQSSHMLRSIDEREEVSKILTSTFDNARDFDRIFKDVNYD